MANVVSFRLKVSGDHLQRRRFRVLVEQHAERIKDGPFKGEYVVHLPPQVWGDMEYDRFFWASPISKGSNSTNGFITVTDHGLEIQGESKWAPPLEFLHRVSERFPELKFEVSSTTEHERYEVWVANDGEVQQLEDEVVDTETGETLYHFKDGEVLSDTAAAK